LAIPIHFEVVLRLGHNVVLCQLILFYFQGSTMNIADIRKEYTQATLDEADALPNPHDLFDRWFQQALGAQLAEPNAMTWPR
jgi:hypothetical protein